MRGRKGREREETERVRSEAKHVRSIYTLVPTGQCFRDGWYLHHVDGGGRGARKAKKHNYVETSAIQYLIERLNLY